MFSLLKREEYGDGLRVKQIPVNRIYPNPNQPRRRFREEAILCLADSIRRHGILQPLCVREQRREGKCVYELIAGERRWRAASLLELESVPCVVMEGVNDCDSAQLSIVENLQRENLNCFEEAMAMEKLMKLMRLSVEQVGAALSLSPGAVCNKIRLLRLPSSQRELILQRELSERHARASLRVADDLDRKRLLLCAADRRLTVQAFEELIKAYLSDPSGVLCQLDAPAPAAPKEEPPRPRPLRRPIIKDIRVFINSVDKALQLVRDSGITVSADKRESEGFVEYSIRVPKVTA